MASPISACGSRDDERVLYHSTPGVTTLWTRVLRLRRWSRPDRGDAVLRAGDARVRHRDVRGLCPRLNDIRALVEPAPPLRRGRIYGFRFGYEGLGSDPAARVDASLRQPDHEAADQFSGPVDQDAAEMAQH